MSREIIISILLGIGLSASSGFRVFIPLLVASVAGYFDFLNLGSGFEWIGSLPAMICFGVAAVIEVAAYYIPIVDNFLDAIAAPLAVVAGALLATSVLPIDDNMSKWTMGIIVGGGSAAAVQSGTSMLRLFSTKATLTTGNPVVATGENTSALAGSVLSLVFPVLIGILFLLMILFITVMFFRWKVKRKKKERETIP